MEIKEKIKNFINENPYIKKVNTAGNIVKKKFPNNKLLIIYLI